MSNRPHFKIIKSQLERMIDVKAVTFNSWWNKGYMKPPVDLGSGPNPGMFSLDEAFAIYVFALTVRREKRKLEEAAVTARYLQNRPGTIEEIYRNWPSNLSLTVYPNYDLAAFNAPHKLIAHRAELGSENYIEKKIKSEEVWYIIHRIENKSLNSPETTDLPFAVDTILKRSQTRPESSQVRRVASLYHMKTFAFPKTLGDKLLLEAWALENIDAGLELSGYINRFTEKATPFTVDVTQVVKDVAKMFRLEDR